MTAKPKVALFIRNGLIGLDSLNTLIPKMLEMGIEPVLCNTGEPPNKKGSIPELADIGFYETRLMKNTVMPFLENRPVLVTSEGQPVPGLCYTPKQLAALYDLEYLDVPNVNDPDFLKSVADDVHIVGGVSKRILQIFKKPAIDVFQQKGFLWNEHTGILPQYKGVHSPYRSIHNGEAEYGWTLHLVDDGIDTGNILLVDKIPLDPRKPVLDTYMDMTDKGADLIIAGLAHYLAHGAPQGIAQTEEEKKSYYTFPIRDFN